jgi:hypothetical protein
MNHHGIMADTKKQSYIRTHVMSPAVFFMKAHRPWEWEAARQHKTLLGGHQLPSKPRITNIVILSTRKTMHHYAATIDSLMR